MDIDTKFATTCIAGVGILLVIAGGVVLYKSSQPRPYVMTPTDSLRVEVLELRGQLHSMDSLYHAKDSLTTHLRTTDSTVEYCNLWLKVFADDYPWIAKRVEQKRQELQGDTTAAE